MSKITTILFWGALWGILEATLGWFLHLIHFNGIVLILYPFGLMCMLMAAKQTCKTSSIIQVALVASLVKLVNLFMLPTVPVYHVLNPAVAIFLEGLVTLAFCIGVNKQRTLKKWSIPFASILVFASIFIYRGWQLIMDTFVTYNPSVHKPFDLTLMTQWLGKSVVQGLMIVIVAYLVQKIHISSSSNKWTTRLSIPLFCIALLLNVLI